MKSFRLNEIMKEWELLVAIKIYVTVSLETWARMLHLAILTMNSF